VPLRVECCATRRGTEATGAESKEGGAPTTTLAVKGKPEYSNYRKGRILKPLSSTKKELFAIEISRGEGRHDEESEIGPGADAPKKRWARDQETHRGDMGGRDGERWYEADGSVAVSCVPGKPWRCTALLPTEWGC
jgi:hypothetical protein